MTKLLAILLLAASSGCATSAQDLTITRSGTMPVEGIYMPFVDTPSRGNYTFPVRLDGATVYRVRGDGFIEEVE